MRTAVLAALLCASALAQTNVDATLTEQRPRQATTTLNFYDSNGNQIYSCTALSLQPLPNLNQLFSIAQSTLTNIVVSANVATATTTANHGLQVGNSVTVTGSATTAVNGTFQIATIPTATTFTYSNTVGSATYTDAGLTISTTAPRSSIPIWNIVKQTFSGTNLTLKQNANGGSSNNICDNRAVTTGATAISYQ
jgi:hypothetical protein